MQQRAHRPYATSLKWRMTHEYLGILWRDGSAEIPFVAMLDDADDYCTSPLLAKKAVREAAPYGEVAVLGHLPGLETFMPLHVNMLLRLLDPAPLTTASLLPRRDQARVVLRRGAFDETKEQLQHVVACVDRFVIFKDKWKALAYCADRCEPRRIVNLEPAVPRSAVNSTLHHGWIAAPEHHFMYTGQFY